MSDDVTEEEIFKEFYNNFCIAASVQGRLAYLLMSIHAVNPYIWQSILGSLMFNYSSMQFFEYLVQKWSHKLYLLTFFGYLSGRIMMVHLLAYLYHVDSRSVVATRATTRNSNFESMYT